MSQRIQLLDCTLRDGGFEFEDAAKYGLTSDSFTPEVMGALLQCLDEAQIDIVELGLMERSAEDRRRFAIYQGIEDISQTIPRDRSRKQMYTAMYRGPDTPLESIPERDPSLCDAVRVMLRYSELEKSLDFCAAHARKGYQVFIQPSVTMRYSDEELRRLVDAANGMGAYALYMVDTYGYMREGDVLRICELYDAGLDPSVRIGFHAHNNINLAFSNALSFLAWETERKIIVDSCVLGFGQGAGNLQTEIITAYMNRAYGTSYNYGAVLDACELIERYYAENMSGYSVMHLLPALHHTAYRYSLALRKQYGLSYREIDRVFGYLTEELRHRCTPENINLLLERSGCVKPDGSGAVQ